MEISKDAFKSVGVLTDDDRPQSLVPSNVLSEQDAICSELLISSVVHFIRDGRWPECIILIGITLIVESVIMLIKHSWH